MLAYSLGQHVRTLIGACDSHKHTVTLSILNLPISLPFRSLGSLHSTSNDPWSSTRTISSCEICANPEGSLELELEVDESNVIGTIMEGEDTIVLFVLLERASLPPDALLTFATCAKQHLRLVSQIYVWLDPV